ncbi:MAG TPA: metal-dependent transcriptional regulator, partial [Candidatus Poseidoniales archaeon]|nr:metal-dependent transcriptional regulator [Candidatus Poseidoniales archaeon]
MRGHFREEATEEYVETIYEFWEKDVEAPVRTNDLANELKVAAATVTGMIKRLSDLGFVDYERYRCVRLTKKGLRLGRQMK